MGGNQRTVGTRCSARQHNMADGAHEGTKICGACNAARSSATAAIAAEESKEEGDGSDKPDPVAW